MTDYLLSIYQPDGDPPAPPLLDRIMKDVGAVQQRMKAAGVWVFAAGLHPPSRARVVRVTSGEVITTDGPFTETKEHLGGFCVIKAASLEAALEWGRSLASATTLPIEVRPLREDERR